MSFTVSGSFECDRCGFTTQVDPPQEPVGLWLKSRGTPETHWLCETCSEDFVSWLDT